MTVREIMMFMESIAPASLAEEWDNVGLLVGDPALSVDKVVVALDITPDAVAFAEEQGAQMIIAHHPVIFSPVRRILAPSVLHQLAVSGIAAFAAHTNLDAADGGVNDALAVALGLTNVREACDGIGRVGTLPSAESPTTFALRVKERLHTAVQLREGLRDIVTVALVSGAGGDYALQTEADAFVTGEMKHHEWLTIPSSMTVVVAGHYATENVIVHPLCERLRGQFPDLTFCPFDGCAPYRTI